MSTNGIDVTGIDLAELLAKLHNSTLALGMGFLHDLQRDVTVEECRQVLVERRGEFRFDYFQGRPLKVSVRDNVLYGAALYDQDCPAGPGSCAQIVAGLRGGGS